MSKKQKPKLVKVKKKCPHKTIIDLGASSTIKQSKCLDCGETVNYNAD